MEKNKVVITDADSFSRELKDFLFDTPYNSIGKKDLQEYIVYLLNNYAEYRQDSVKRKFSELSDLELQSLFRVDKRALRTIQTNVEIKYGHYDFSDKHLLTELMSLPKRNFTVTKDGKVHLVIENGIVRNHFESKLRDICGTVFDYHNNPSMVTVEASLFIECLANLLENVGGEKDNADAEYETLKSQLKKLKREDVVKKLIEGGKTFVSTVSAVGKIASGTENVISMSVSLLSFLTNLFAKKQNEITSTTVNC